MLNAKEGARILGLLKDIPSPEDRLQAAMILCSSETVMSACKMQPSPPTVMPGGSLVYRFGDHRLMDCETMPAISYCSCSFFERQGITLLIPFMLMLLVVQARMAPLCPHLLRLALD